MNVVNNLFKKTRKMEWYDFSALKIGIAAFALLVAKIWPKILSLNIWWYVIVLGIAYTRLLYVMFGKK